MVNSATESLVRPKERADIGARLKEAREYLGLSQQEVATSLNLPRTAVSMIESGQRGVESSAREVTRRGSDGRDAEDACALSSCHDSLSGYRGLAELVHQEHDSG